jgi:hypothetical protein
LPKAFGKVVKVIATLIPLLPSEFHYQIVLMRRALPEILASQLKMLSNRGQDPNIFNPEMMINVYQKHLHQVESWLNQQTNVRFIEISYNELLSDPKPHLVVSLSTDYNMGRRKHAEKAEPATSDRRGA